MGERIRDIGFLPNGLNIELNESPSIGGRKVIHLQNKFFRLEMTDEEFVAFSCMAIYAGRKLKNYKNVED